MDLDTLCGVFAASLPGKRPGERFFLGADGETATVAEAVRAIHGKAELTPDGTLFVEPAKKAKPAARAIFPAAGPTLFWFLSGLAAALTVPWATLRVEPDVLPRDFLGAFRTTGEATVLMQKGACCVFSAVVKPDRIPIFPETPPAFAAGMMIGAVLAPGDSDFVFVCCDPAPEHLTAIEQIRAHGGKTEELLDGFRIRTKNPAPPRVFLL